MHERNGQSGVTLIELLIAIVLGSIVVLAAYASFGYFFSEVRKGGEKAGLQRDADLAAYWIELTIREGSWALLNDDTNDSLVVENFVDGWEKTIYADAGRLVVDIGGDQEDVINTLSAIHFYPRIASVEYDLEVQKGSDAYTLTSSKNLRNVEYQGLWHFSEGSGDIAYDDSPFNNNGGLHGAAWTGGMIGTGLQFDGQDDHLLIPDNDGLDSGRRVAYSAWVQGAGFDSPRTIINRNAPDSTHGFFWVYVQGNGIHYSFSTGGVVTLSSDSLSWEAGKWYEVYVQHDDHERRVHFYRDGIKVGEGSYAGSMIPVTSGDAYIGSCQGGEHFWHGKLDEVKFANFQG